MEVYTEKIIMLWYLEKNPKALKNTVFFKCFREATQMKNTTFASKIKYFIPVEKANMYLCRNECHPEELRSADAHCLLTAVESVTKCYWCQMCPDVPSMPLFIAILEIKTCKLPITSLAQNIPWKRGSVGTRKDKSLVWLQMLVAQSEAVLLSVLS